VLSTGLFGSTIHDDEIQISEDGEATASCSETSIVIDTMATSLNDLTLTVPLLLEQEPQSANSSTPRPRASNPIEEEEVRRRAADAASREASAVRRMTVDAASRHERTLRRRTADADADAASGQDSACSCADWLWVAAFLPLLSGMYILFVVGSVDNVPDGELPSDTVLRANVWGSLLILVGGFMLVYARLLKVPPAAAVESISDIRGSGIRNHFLPPLPSSVARYLPVPPPATTRTTPSGAPAGEDVANRFLEQQGDETTTSDDEEQDLQRSIAASLEDSRRHLEGSNA
jgi:hypothetical protein